MSELSVSTKGPASSSLAASYSGAVGYDAANVLSQRMAVIDKADAVGHEESLIRFHLRETYICKENMSGNARTRF